jgi:2-polyprenyl-6-methoxyphenol hydroxylase-like FAD-dependent oxidoreductase
VTLDILINGGGIAGPCLAFWLTRQGHSVTIAEQARQLRTGGQAVDFRGSSLKVLEKMSLLGQVRSNATRMGPLILVDVRGKEIGRLPAEVVSGELEIFWGDLARILFEAVREDVNYRFGIRVTALNDNGELVEATFSDESTGSYHLVVGADRLHSGVRSLVFGPDEHYVTQLGQCFGFFDIENRLRLDHCGMALATSGRTAALQATDPDKPLFTGLARPTTQRRYSTAEHPGRQQAGRQAITGRRTFLHPAELLTRSLHRGSAVPAGAGSETSRTFRRFGGHAGNAGEFAVKSV